jgi:YVTN family beta-propeller protein
MSRRPLLPVLALTVAFGLTAGAVAQAGSGIDYHLTRSISLGAPDRWDYLVYDGPSHRLYVSHGDHLTVVDGRTGRVIGQVEGMPGGTHGIAISHAAGLGYTDDGEAAEAVAFNLKTLKVVKHLKAAPDADAVTIDPASGHVFVVDGDPGLLTVIDPKTDRVVATVHAGSKMEYAVAGDNGKVYVNGVAKRVIYRVDTKTNQVDPRGRSRNARRPTDWPWILRRIDFSRAVRINASWSSMPIPAR